MSLPEQPPLADNTLQLAKESQTKRSITMDDIYRRELARLVADNTPVLLPQTQTQAYQQS